MSLLICNSIVVIRIIRSVFFRNERSVHIITLCRFACVFSKAKQTLSEKYEFHNFSCVPCVCNHQLYSRAWRVNLYACLLRYNVSFLITNQRAHKCNFVLTARCGVYSVPSNEVAAIHVGIKLEYFAELLTYVINGASLKRKYFS